MKNTYDISKAFQRIEEYLIKSMKRNLSRHLKTEGKEDIIFSQWQAEQLKALQNFKKNNAKEFKDYFSTINDDIDDMLRGFYKDGQLDQERKILESLKKGAKIPNYHSPNASFFRVNDKKLNALIKATTNDMKKAEQAVLRMANDQYRQVIFDSQVYFNTGAGTLEQAIDMATKDFLARGINCIEYKNGARHNITNYSEMALRTANLRAKIQGEGDKRNEWGIHLVSVPSRGGGCPLCIPFQGKVFIDDVWSGGSKTDGKYPLLSSAMASGFLHPNCKDGVNTYFEGINTPPKPPTAEEKREKILRYKKDQENNYCQQQIDKYRRLEIGSLDKENKAKYKAKKEEWEVRQKQINNKYNGTIEKYEPKEIEEVKTKTFKSDYVVKDWEDINNGELGSYYKRNVVQYENDKKILNDNNQDYKILDNNKDISILNQFKQNNSKDESREWILNNYGYAFKKFKVYDKNKDNWKEVLDEIINSKEQSIKTRVNWYKSKILNSEKQMQLIDSFDNLAKSKGLEISKSPYSDSFYAHKKGEVIGWGIKPENSYRLADHWNWGDRTDPTQIHCETSTGKDLGMAIAQQRNGKYVELSIDDLKKEIKKQKKLNKK